MSEKFLLELGKLCFDKKDKVKIDTLKQKLQSSEASSVLAINAKTIIEILKKSFHSILDCTHTLKDAPKEIKAKQTDIFLSILSKLSKEKQQQELQALSSLQIKDLIIHANEIYTTEGDEGKKEEIKNLVQSSILEYIQKITTNTSENVLNTVLDSLPNIQSDITEGIEIYKNTDGLTLCDILDKHYNSKTREDVITYYQIGQKLHFGMKDAKILIDKFKQQFQQMLFATRDIYNQEIFIVNDENPMLDAQVQQDFFKQRSLTPAKEFEKAVAKKLQQAYQTYLDKMKENEAIINYLISENPIKVSTDIINEVENAYASYKKNQQNKGNFSDFMSSRQDLHPLLTAQKRPKKVNTLLPNISASDIPLSKKMPFSEFIDKNSTLRDKKIYPEPFSYSKMNNGKTELIIVKMPQTTIGEMVKQLSNHRIWSSSYDLESSRYAAATWWHFSQDYFGTETPSEIYKNNHQTFQANQFSDFVKLNNSEVRAFAADFKKATQAKFNEQYNIDSEKVIILKKISDLDAVYQILGTRDIPRRISQALTLIQEKKYKDALSLEGLIDEVNEAYSGINELIQQIPQAGRNLSVIQNISHKYELYQASIDSREKASNKLQVLLESPETTETRAQLPALINEEFQIVSSTLGLQGDFTSLAKHTSDHLCDLIEAVKNQQPLIDLRNIDKDQELIQLVMDWLSENRPDIDLINSHIKIKHSETNAVIVELSVPNQGHQEIPLSLPDSQKCKHSLVKPVGTMEFSYSIGGKRGVNFPYQKIKQIYGKQIARYLMSYVTAVGQQGTVKFYVKPNGKIFVNKTGFIDKDNTPTFDPKYFSERLIRRLLSRNDNLIHNEVVFLKILNQARPTSIQYFEKKESKQGAIFLDKNPTSYSLSSDVAPGVSLADETLKEIKDVEKTSERFLNPTSNWDMGEASYQRQFFEELKIAQALSQEIGKLHTKGFSHNDIKPENFFYLRKPDGSYNITFIDLATGGVSGEYPLSEEEKKISDHRQLFKHIFHHEPLARFSNPYKDNLGHELTIIDGKCIVSITPKLDIFGEKKHGTLAYLPPEALKAKNECISKNSPYALTSTNDPLFDDWAATVLAFGICNKSAYFDFVQGRAVGDYVLPGYIEIDGNGLKPTLKFDGYYNPYPGYKTDVMYVPSNKHEGEPLHLFKKLLKLKDHIAALKDTVSEREQAICAHLLTDIDEVCATVYHSVNDKKGLTNSELQAQLQKVQDIFTKFQQLQNNTLQESHDAKIRAMITAFNQSSTKRFFIHAIVAGVTPEIRNLEYILKYTSPETLEEVKTFLSESRFENEADQMVSALDYLPKIANNQTNALNEAYQLLIENHQEDLFLFILEKQGSTFPCPPNLLHYAIQERLPRLASKLIDLYPVATLYTDTSPNSFLHRLANPLQLAIYNNEHELAKKIYEKLNRQAPRSAAQGNALLLAAQLGQIGLFRTLVPKPSYQSLKTVTDAITGYNALHYFCGMPEANEYLMATHHIEEFITSAPYPIFIALDNGNLGLLDSMLSKLSADQILAQKNDGGLNIFECLLKASNTKLFLGLLGKMDASKKEDILCGAPLSPLMPYLNSRASYKDKFSFLSQLLLSLETQELKFQALLKIKDWLELAVSATTLGLEQGLNPENITHVISLLETLDIPHAVILASQFSADNVIGTSYLDAYTKNSIINPLVPPNFKDILTTISAQKIPPNSSKEELATIFSQIKDKLPKTLQILEESLKLQQIFDDREKLQSQISQLEKANETLTKQTSEALHERDAAKANSEEVSRLKEQLKIQGAKLSSLAESLNANKRELDTQIKTIQTLDAENQSLKDAEKRFGADYQALQLRLDKQIDLNDSQQTAIDTLKETIQDKQKLLAQKTKELESLSEIFKVLSNFMSHLDYANIDSIQDAIDNAEAITTRYNELKLDPKNEQLLLTYGEQILKLFQSLLASANTAESFKALKQANQQLEKELLNFKQISAEEMRQLSASQQKFKEDLEQKYQASIQTFIKGLPEDFRMNETASSEELLQHLSKKITDTVGSYQETIRDIRDEMEQSQKTAIFAVLEKNEALKKLETLTERKNLLERNSKIVAEQLKNIQTFFGKDSFADIQTHFEDTTKELAKLQQENEQLKEASKKYEQDYAETRKKLTGAFTTTPENIERFTNLELLTILLASNAQIKQENQAEIDEIKRELSTHREEQLAFIKQISSPEKQLTSLADVVSLNQAQTQEIAELKQTLLKQAFDIYKEQLQAYAADTPPTSSLNFEDCPKNGVLSNELIEQRKPYIAQYISLEKGQITAEDVAEIKKILTQSQFIEREVHLGIQTQLTQLQFDIEHIRADKENALKRIKELEQKISAIVTANENLKVDTSSLKLAIDKKETEIKTHLDSTLAYLKDIGSQLGLTPSIQKLPIIEEIKYYQTGISKRISNVLTENKQTNATLLNNEQLNIQLETQQSQLEELSKALNQSDIDFGKAQTSLKQEIETLTHVLTAKDTRIALLESMLDGILNPEKPETQTLLQKYQTNTEDGALLEKFKSIITAQNASDTKALELTYKFENATAKHQEEVSAIQATIKELFEKNGLQYTEQPISGALQLLDSNYQEKIQELKASLEESNKKIQEMYNEASLNTDKIKQFETLNAELQEKLKSSLQELQELGGLNNTLNDEVKKAKITIDNQLEQIEDLRASQQAFIEEQCTKLIEFIQTLEAHYPTPPGLYDEKKLALLQEIIKEIFDTTTQEITHLNSENLLLQENRERFSILEAQLKKFSSAMMPELETYPHEAEEALGLIKEKFEAINQSLHEIYLSLRMPSTKSMQKDTPFERYTAFMQVLDESSSVTTEVEFEKIQKTFSKSEFQSLQLEETIASKVSDITNYLYYHWIPENISHTAIISLNEKQKTDIQELMGEINTLDSQSKFEEFLAALSELITPTPLSETENSDDSQYFALDDIYQNTAEATIQTELDRLDIDQKLEQIQLMINALQDSNQQLTIEQKEALENFNQLKKEKEQAHQAYLEKHFEHQHQSLAQIKEQFKLFGVVFTEDNSNPSINLDTALDEEFTLDTFDNIYSSLSNFETQTPQSIEALIAKLEPYIKKSQEALMKKGKAFISNLQTQEKSHASKIDELNKKLALEEEKTKKSEIISASKTQEIEQLNNQILLMQKEYTKLGDAIRQIMPATGESLLAVSALGFAELTGLISELGDIHTKNQTELSDLKARIKLEQQAILDANIRLIQQLDSHFTADSLGMESVAAQISQYQDILSKKITEAQKLFAQKVKEYKDSDEVSKKNNHEKTLEITNLAKSLSAQENLTSSMYQGIQSAIKLLLDNIIPDSGEVEKLNLSELEKSSQALEIDTEVLQNLDTAIRNLKESHQMQLADIESKSSRAYQQIASEKEKIERALSQSFASNIAALEKFAGQSQGQFPIKDIPKEGLDALELLVSRKPYIYNFIQTAKVSNPENIQILSELLTESIDIQIRAFTQQIDALKDSTEAREELIEKNKELSEQIGLFEEEKSSLKVEFQAALEQLKGKALAQKNEFEQELYTAQCTKLIEFIQTLEADYPTPASPFNQETLSSLHEKIAALLTDTKDEITRLKDENLLLEENQSELKKLNEKLESFKQLQVDSLRKNLGVLENELMTLNQEIYRINDSLNKILATLNPISSKQTKVTINEEFPSLLSELNLISETLDFKTFEQTHQNTTYPNFKTVKTEKSERNGSPPNSQLSENCKKYILYKWLPANITSEQLKTLDEKNKSKLKGWIDSFQVPEEASFNQLLVDIKNLFSPLTNKSSVSTNESPIMSFQSFQEDSPFVRYTAFMQVIGESALTDEKFLEKKPDKYPKPIFQAISATNPLHSSQSHIIRKKNITEYLYYNWIPENISITAITSLNNTQKTTIKELMGNISTLTSNIKFEEFLKQLSNIITPPEVKKTESLDDSEVPAMDDIYSNAAVASVPNAPITLKLDDIYSNAAVASVPNAPITLKFVTSKLDKIQSMITNLQKSNQKLTIDQKEAIQKFTELQQEKELAHQAYLEKHFEHQRQSLTQIKTQIDLTKPRASEGTASDSITDDTKFLAELNASFNEETFQAIYQYLQAQGGRLDFIGEQQSSIDKYIAKANAYLKKEEKDFESIIKTLQKKESDYEENTTLLTKRLEDTNTELKSHHLTNEQTAEAYSSLEAQFKLLSERHSSYGEKISQFLKDSFGMTLELGDKVAGGIVTGSIQSGAVTTATTLGVGALLGDRLLSAIQGLINHHDTHSRQLSVAQGQLKDKQQALLDKNSTLIQQLHDSLLADSDAKIPHIPEIKGSTFIEKLEYSQDILSGYITKHLQTFKDKISEYQRAMINGTEDLKTIQKELDKIKEINKQLENADISTKEQIKSKEQALSELTDKFNKLSSEKKDAIDFLQQQGLKIREDISLDELLKNYTTTTNNSITTLEKAQKKFLSTLAQQLGCEPTNIKNKLDELKAELEKRQQIEAEINAFIDEITQPIPSEDVKIIAAQEHIAQENRTLERLKTAIAQMQATHQATMNKKLEEATKILDKREQQLNDDYLGIQAQISKSLLGIMDIDGVEKPILPPQTQTFNADWIKEAFSAQQNYFLAVQKHLYP